MASPERIFDWTTVPRKNAESNMRTPGADASRKSAARYTASRRARRLTVRMARLYSGGRAAPEDSEGSAHDDQANSACLGFLEGVEAGLPAGPGARANVQGRAHRVQRGGHRDAGARGGRGICFADGRP